MKQEVPSTAKYFIVARHLDPSVIFAVDQDRGLFIITLNQSNTEGLALFKGCEGPAAPEIRRKIWEVVKERVTGKASISVCNRALSSILTPAPTPGRQAANRSSKASSPETGKTLLSSEGWFDLSAWGKEKNVIQGWERKFAYDVGVRIARGKSLTEKQLPIAESILARCKKLGFRVVSPQQAPSSKPVQAPLSKASPLKVLSDRKARELIEELADPEKRAHATSYLNFLLGTASRPVRPDRYWVDNVEHRVRKAYQKG